MRLLRYARNDELLDFLRDYQYSLEVTKPQLMMLDEPSQGLAPVLVQSVFETIQKMQDELGLTILLVEQNADAALNAASYVYIMHEGLIKAEGKPEDIKGSQDIREAYLVI